MYALHASLLNSQKKINQRAPHTHTHTPSHVAFARHTHTENT